MSRCPPLRIHRSGDHPQRFRPQWCCSVDTALDLRQLGADDEWNVTAPPTFEVYGLASGLTTIDATGTVIIRNPQPNQTLPFTPRGLGSGARVCFGWRHENAELLADFGFHKYSDRTGSTSMAPLMVGIRAYSHERFRTSFFGEGLAGAYQWTVNAGAVNFATVKGIVSCGADSCKAWRQPMADCRPRWLALDSNAHAAI